MRRFGIISLILVIALLLASVPVSAATSQNNSNNPINATDIQIVKKITLKGGGSRGGKTTPAGAATGTVNTFSTANKYAVIIGIEEYPGTGSDLQYSVDDADEMYTVLTTQYGFSPDRYTSDPNTIVLEDPAATIDTIYSAVNAIKAKVTALGASASDAEMVFFFSGHGAKGKFNDGDTSSIDQAIVVNNTDCSNFAYIWDGQMVQLFKNFPTSHIVFIFDSCLSGGMSVLKAPGRIVNMACSANGYSYESDSWGGGHGQFTYYFAEKGMQFGAANVKPVDDVVTAEEAFDYAKSKCVYQTPTISDSFTDDLVP